MKKIFKMILLSVSFAAMIFGCAKFDNNVDGTKAMNSNGEYAIMFSNSPSTKATVGDNNVATYNEFALYTWNSNAEVIMNPYIVKKESGKWNYVVDGSQELKFFKNNADNYNFIGVIPTAGFTFNENKVTGNVKSFTVDDSRVNGTITTNSPDEFLYAYKNVEKVDYKNDVTLDFKHGNALLYLGFISDDANTKILDYTPTIPAVPASQGTPDTETYTKKTVKFIDELVAGNEVQVAIGFYGANSPKLTKSQPNPLYIGSDNTNNGYLAKTWLLSIKDAVNSQFVYYRLNSVNNSTSKTETTEDWDSKASSKNIYMMKLADGVDKAAFAAGNDAFATALKAHQTDWVGGSPAESFWAMFEQAYAAGWRVVRINTNVAYKNFPTDMTVESTKDSEVYVYLASNVETSTQVCTITPGTPATPGSPEVPGIDGIRIFSAKADATNGYAHVEHTMTADATVSTDLSFDNRVTSSDVIQFSLPTANVPVGTTEADAIYSPTTFYAIPGDTDLTHFVVKVSYEYKGDKVYDVRVPIELPAAGLEAGKYYKYVINITSTGNGTNDPSEADPEKGEIDIVNNPIVVTVNVTDYAKGDIKIITI